MVIETKRLILRPFLETDAADVYEYLKEPAVNCFASKFKSEVKVAYKGRSVNMKSIMGVMSLGIPTQSEVTVTCEGEDEEVAITTIEEVLRAQKVIA